jgi:two-component system, response regulator YesN
MNVLICDPAPFIRDNLLLVLKDYRDIFASGAATAGEALSLSATVKPDFVILDPLLPDMNPTEYIREQREIAPDARFILMSRTIDRDQMIHFMQQGIKDILIKPFRIDQLIKKLKPAESYGATV